MVVLFFAATGRDPYTGLYGLMALLGGLGMVYVVYLLAKHASFAAGTASNDWVFAAIPWVVAAAGIGGIALALTLKYTAPHRYDDLGRTVLEEAHER
ncbi:Putative amino acid permease family protein [Mycobacteroides abscessus]|nr:Putative amino acid permease family protein [Mycobacteroides abscessus]